MEAVRRKICDAADAAVCLAAIAESGGSLSDWCRENGVDGRSLHVWRVAQMRREGRVSNRPRLVELVRTPRTSAHPLTVRNGEFSVDIGRGFDPELLGAVLRVLRKC